MTGKTIKEINVGDLCEELFYIDEKALITYADLTGDYNPIHWNDIYAKQTFFKNRIVHGMLLGGYISKVLGTVLPGEGCIYLKQEMIFLKPVYVNEYITIRVEVLSKNVTKNHVTLLTQCFNRNGEKCVDGKAVVLPTAISGKKPQN